MHVMNKKLHYAFEISTTYYMCCIRQICLAIYKYWLTFIISTQPGVTFIYIYAEENLEYRD